ncbi:MAG: TonB-dependent receptor [Caldimonas sp.]
MRTRPSSGVGLMVALFAGAAAAADEPVQTAPVVITGSRLPRDPADLLVPVSVIERREIERWGAATAGEALFALPFNNGGAANPNNADGGSNPGYASVSLRGLGSNATLVLVNGRRVAPFGFSGVAVDLNSIPVTAIARIEILRDGGSALYGAEAIAGVVNIVLRTDYDGAELRLGGTGGQHLGASQASATFGRSATGDGALGWLVTVDQRQSRALNAADRDFARTAYRPARGLDATSSVGFPGGYASDLSSPYVAFSSAGLACDPTLHRGAVAAGEACRYDYVVDSTIAPRFDGRAVFGRARYELHGGAALYAELSYSDNRYLYRTSATPVWGALAASGEPYVLPAASPANPFGVDTQFRTRTTALGPRTNQARSRGQRLLLGLQWSGGDWEVDSTIGTSASLARDELLGGHVSDTRYRAAVARGDIDPFGTLAASDLAPLRATQASGTSRQADARMEWLDTRATTRLHQGLGRDVGLAAGVELRRERLQDAATALLTSGDVLGVAAPLSAVTGGRRRAGAIYGELLVPVFADLNAQLGARADWYSDFGLAVSPKLAAVWTPVRWAALRASASRSFRAPSLAELHVARLTALTGPLDDPVRCPNGVPQPGANPATDCGAQFGQLGGGNPDLDPERSTNLTLGLVLRPDPGWALSVTRWQIDKSADIGIVRDATTLDPASYPSLAGLVTRGPATPADVANGLPGSIVLIDTSNRNLGRSRFAGWDFELRGRAGRVFGGVLDLSATSALLVRADQQLIPGGATVRLLGGSLNGRPTQRWRHAVALDWRQAGWSLGARAERIGSYEDENPDADGQPRRVAAWGTLGLSAGVTAGPWEGGLAVTNLFDRAPPFSNKTSAFAAGWDDLSHDPRGRAVHAFLRYALR